MEAMMSERARIVSMGKGHDSVALRAPGAQRS